MIRYILDIYLIIKIEHILNSMKIFYVTSNKYKLQHALDYTQGLDFQIEAKKLRLREIQSSSIEEVVKDKALQAWNILKKPLVVSDSGWEIPILNGFPGPYMSDINKWFTSQDFINLMLSKKNKTIYLNHLVAAVKNGEVKVFSEKTKGEIINQPRGNGSSLDCVVIMEGSNKTIAENQDKGLLSTNGKKIWREIFNYMLKD